jgi:tight adherence protein B
MQTILLSAVVALIVFILFLLLMPRVVSSDKDKRKRILLDQMTKDTVITGLKAAEGIDLLKDETTQFNSSPLFSVVSQIPGALKLFELLLKSGLFYKRQAFFLILLVVLIVLCFLFRKLGLIGYVIAVAVTYIGAVKYLRHRIATRNAQFLTLFPDAIDMIIRSVRSGHPLNTAMRMIVENMDNPIRDEFKQVVDEVSYGRTLPEALLRMSQRVDEPDLNFFVVVLSVQQETGGSLAEVLSNLSSVIRKRRQLRLKIKALTSEGRATSYILGALPVMEIGAIYYITPDYLTPLFTSLIGNIVLGAAVALIVGSMWIVRKMVDITI